MNFLSNLSILNPNPSLSVQVTDKSPLAALYENKYDLARYFYPRDLASNPAKQHVILFETLVPDGDSPQAITEKDFSKLGTSIKNLGLNTLDQFKNFASSVQSGKSVLDSLKGINPDATEQSALELASSLAETGIKFTNTQIGRKIGTTIALYVPDTVNVQYGASYSDVSLTETLGKPYFYAQAGASLYEYYKNYNGETVSQMMAKAANDPMLRTALARFIGDKVGTGDLTGLTLNALGQAFNPQLQVLFTGIGFRSFQFDFTLTPYSKQEAEMIKNIVEAFKYAAAPEIIPNGLFTQGLFQKVPDQFNVKFLYNGKPNDQVHKIGVCVLTNINVDYAPMGWATFGDGTPVQTKLTLQFQETEIIDKTKISQGY